MIRISNSFYPAIALLFINGNTSRIFLSLEYLYSPEFCPAPKYVCAQLKRKAFRCDNQARMHEYSALSPLLILIK
ncbi:hypothetical protein EBS43_04735 [bacterium]|nr:hypothetical protein [bacterium]